MKQENLQIWHSQPLGLLHLPSRCQNPLERVGILTIGDLFSLSDSELSATPKLGFTSSQKIQSIKKAFLDSITDSETVNWFEFWSSQEIKIIPDNFDEITTEEQIIRGLPAIIKEILDQNADERLWFILQRRLGLEGTEKLTLEELGLAFGLTRERVRQLEASVFDELRRVLIADDYKSKTYHVHPKVLEAVRRLSGIVTQGTTQAILEDSLLNQIELNFNIIPEVIKPSLYLVLNLSGLTKLDFNTDTLQSVWGRFDPSEAKLTQNLVERLNKLLTEENALPLSEIDILVQINKGTRKRNRLSFEQLRQLIEICSSVEIHKAGFYWGKFEYLTGRGNQVERVLFEYGEPVHINEVVREINHRLTLHGKRVVNPRNLANQMSSDSRFVPIGRSGEWGLSSWSVDTGTIVEQMKLFLISRNQPATVDEIYSYVSERRPVRKSSVEAYLTFQEDFAKVDRTKWGLAEWSEAKNAQNWNPEQVGQFVEELFRKNKARKLKYQIIKQALMEAAGVKNRQAQGLLGVNPVIKTERDETGELYAIFQPKYRDTLKNSEGVRFNRKKKTLRVLVSETVKETLESSPGEQIALSELISLLVEKFKKRDKTFYHYIADLEYVQKFTIPDTRVVMCRLKQQDSPLPFPQVEDIQTIELRQKVGRALTFLNETDVDISLFLLSKEFEATLEGYLVTGKTKGQFLDLPASRLNLDGMISYIKSKNIITDQAVLHFLRQKRNDRAHGSMPDIEERRVMMKYAQITAGMYIDYIKYFDDLTQTI